MKMHASLLIATLMLVTASAQTFAADEVRRSHRFDTAGIEHLNIELRAGEVVVEPARGEEIEIELRLEANGGWWFGSAPDVTGMDLSAETRGDRLTLSFQEDDVNSHWVVRVPALTSFTVDGGVGQISGRVPPMAVNVDLGVGDVKLDVERAAVGNIELTAGVGGTAVDGADDEQTQRNFVSSRSSAHGLGDHRLRTSVGVGDVRVRMQ